MDEVYTCGCGCQNFTIHHDYVECNDCRKEYLVEIFKLCDPRDFNYKREEFLRTI